MSSCRTKTCCKPRLGGIAITLFLIQLPGFPSKAPITTSLPDFPKDIELKVERYENWAVATVVDKVWVAYPKNSSDILTIVNYAHKNCMQARASGCRHNWSPFTVNENSYSEACPKKDLILINTKTHLNNLNLVKSDTDPTLSLLWAETGATVDDSLSYLESLGYVLKVVPATGQITVGGVQAIGGHGATSSLDSTWRAGSFSSQIHSFTAVVWDEELKKYVFRKFVNTDADFPAYLVHLGRTIISEVWIKVYSNVRLCCQSFLDIPMTELFADPKSLSEKPGTRTFTKFMDQKDGYGVEVVLFSYTDCPWLKVWTVCPSIPLGFRETESPYNYPFSDSFPDPVPWLVHLIVDQGLWFLAPLLGQASYGAAVSGLPAFSAWNLWGWSKNVLLYIRDTTLRFNENSLCILTKRENVQQVLYEVYTLFDTLLTEYKAKGIFPINGAFEVRVGGTEDSEIRPYISSQNPNPIKDFDVAVYFNTLAFPGTPYFFEFSAKMEEFCYERFTGDDLALCRPEWSKGWAYTPAEDWSNETILTKIKNSFPDWNTATTILNKNDPNRVMSNKFLDKFLAVDSSSCLKPEESL